MAVPYNQKYIIALMGATGTGKSSFVNLVIGKVVAKIAHGLQSGTSTVSSYPFTYRTREFILVDTPGFDDSTLSDRDILQRLVTWLENSFRNGQKLAGILYLHRITDPRVSGSALSNLRTFRELCGEDCFKNVILCTSFWNAVSQEQGIGRERELINNKEYWASMIQRGSQVLRLPSDQYSARELVFRFVGSKLVTLQSQRETVIEGKTFDETSATQQLQYEEKVKEMKAENQRRMAERQACLDAELKARERTAEANARKQEAELQRRLAAQRIDQERLKVEREREEERMKAAAEAVEKERERIKQETADLAEKMENLTIERFNTTRRLKWDNYVGRRDLTVQLLVAAHTANKLMVEFRPISQVYNTICDNCFRNIGLEEFYQCPFCNDGDFDLCLTCYSDRGIFCNNRWHFSSMKRMTIDPEGNQNCRRVKDPIPVGVKLTCSRCLEACGILYLHCCFCDNDQFDMCMPCAMKFKTCKKSWSLSGHPLDICTRYIES